MAGPGGSCNTERGGGLSDAESLCVGALTSRHQEIANAGKESSGMLITVE